MRPKIAKHLMSKFAKIKINTVIASELPFSPDDIESNSTLVAISQSGESADVLEAVKIAKESNANILSVVNHLNSSLFTRIIISDWIELWTGNWCCCNKEFYITTCNII